MESGVNKKKKALKVTAIICIIAVVLVFTFPLLLAAFIYQSNFGGRFETPVWISRGIDEFDGLNRERYAFDSNQGQSLIGYKYYRESEAVKGVVIIAHGLGGGGHNTYMDVADYLTRNGYFVFAYDATGNDESEGKSVKGVPQGLIDLDYAVRFVKSAPEFENLPIMLFGHSWGAYCAGSVLNIHDDIKAVVMVAGFNQSADIIREEGERITGRDISAMMPHISFIERVKFGGYSSYTCLDGFAASNAGVMAIHSADDEAVSFENHFMRFSEAYGHDPRFVFIEYKDRGHDYVYYSEAVKARQETFLKQLEDYAESIGAELSAEFKTDYMNENGDKSELFELDEELMERVASFYDSYAGL